MAANNGTFVDLEEEKQFLFNYNQKIERENRFIRSGDRRQAIVRSHVKGKIKLVDQNEYDKLMRGKIKEEDLKYDFCYTPDGNIVPRLGITISYLSSLKGVYFCRHLRDNHRDYRWLAVRFFFSKNYPSHLVRFRTFETCFDVTTLLIIYPKAMKVMFTTSYASA